MMRVWHVQVCKKYIFFQLRVNKRRLIPRAIHNKNGGYLERSEKYWDDCQETFGDINFAVIVDFATVLHHNRERGCVWRCGTMHEYKITS